MELKWLKTFVAVYECGNFSLAAERLFISQPSITVHIKLLEESLQVALFERNHTQVQLTDEGAYFYSLAKELLDKVDENKRLLQSYSVNKKIQLIIALSPLLVTTKIPEYLYEFMQTYTHYEVEIVIEEADQIDEQLRKKKIDIAIGLNSSNYKDIHAEQLLSCPLELVFPSTYDSSDKQITPLLTDLFQRYPVFIGYLDAINPILNHIEHEHKITRKNQIKQSDIVKQLIIRGLGIGFLPRFLIETELAKGELKSLDLHPITKFYPVEIYLKHIRESDKLIPLLKFMRGKFQKV